MKSKETQCVQAGYNPKNGEARVSPICQSTTFAYETPEEMGDLFDLKKSGYFYTRLGNPSNNVLEEKINALEGGVGALATASGMSATYLAALNILSAGDNFISISTIYGGTFNLFTVSLKKLGMECRMVSPDATAEEIEKLIDGKTRFIFGETLANPAGIVLNFEKIATVCKKHQVVFMVDNTLATPIICRPFEHGVNIIVHSTTKYIDGHATSVGGLIVDGGNFKFLGNPRYPEFNTPDDSYHGLVYARDIAVGSFITKARVQCMRDYGCQMAPMNAFLTTLGSETLHLRMPRHSSNALAVAEFLNSNANVEWVKYAGLQNDPNYPLITKYFDYKMCSGMVSFGIKGGIDKAMQFQKKLKLFRIVTHVADIRSCVLHPASTTHRQLSEESLKQCGISPNLIRLSVGIENVEDILADLKNALI